ncbi:hypothetical protein AGR1B_Lc70039 [Agrobacterium fabacearum S56]|nr:hypothetical protein AGR1B_Lc70039 [Agrobacterium fabacearum S56]
MLQAAVGVLKQIQGIRQLATALGREECRRRTHGTGLYRSNASREHPHHPRNLAARQRELEVRLKVLLGTWILNQLQKAGGWNGCADAAPLTAV